MYLGNAKISSMENFLHGYDFACLVNNIEHYNTFPLFWYFHEWVKEEYNWEASTAGWKNIILKENNNDEIKALNVFFNLIAEFKKLHPISIEYIELTKENLEFHHSELCSAKTYNSETKEFDLPIYRSVDKIYIIEHSHNFGFSIFATYGDKLTGNDWTERFKDSKKAKSVIKSQFNTNEEWKPLTENLTKEINKIVKYSC